MPVVRMVSSSAAGMPGLGDSYLSETAAPAATKAASAAPTNASSTAVAKDLAKCPPDAFKSLKLLWSRGGLKTGWTTSKKVRRRIS